MSKRSFDKQRRIVEMTRIGCRSEDERELGKPDLAQPQLKFIQQQPIESWHGTCLSVCQLHHLADFQLSLTSKLEDRPLVDFKIKAYGLTLHQSPLSTPAIQEPTSIHAKHQ